MKLSGLNRDIAQSIEERVSEFEVNHERDLVKGGCGWVPRIRKVDYIIALAINGAITLWLAIALIWD
jgi:hypothetical protein